MKTSLYPIQPLPAPLPWSHGLYFCIATQNSLPLSRLPPAFMDQPHQSLQQDQSPELMPLLLCDTSPSTRIPQTLTSPSGGAWGPSFLQD